MGVFTRRNVRHFNVETYQGPVPPEIGLEKDFHRQILNNYPIIILITYHAYVFQIWSRRILMVANHAFWQGNMSTEEYLRSI